MTRGKSRPEQSVNTAVPDVLGGVAAPGIAQQLGDMAVTHLANPLALAKAREIAGGEDDRVITFTDNPDSVLVINNPDQPLPWVDETEIRPLSGGRK